MTGLLSLFYVRIAIIQLVGNFASYLLSSSRFHFPFILSNMQKSAATRPRIDALDGIRTVAVILVIAFHVSAPRMAAGYIGVDIFFVLSGFLITSSLLSDISKHNKVRLKRFWSRRIARLMPAALLTIIAVLVMSWASGLLYVKAEIGNDAWYTIFYLANWHFMGSGSYFESDGTSSPLLHMWSLAVEEQFYFIWPLIIVAVFWAVSQQSEHHQLRVFRFRLGIFAGLAIAISIILLAIFSQSSVDRAYMGTDSKAFEPMLGALGSVLAHNPELKDVFSKHSRLMVWIGGIAMILLFSFMDGPSTLYFQGGAALFSLSALALILGIRYGLDNFEAKILAWTPISYLGRISYGLYLWHWPYAVWILNPENGFEPCKALIVASLTLTTASLSFHFLEMPIREGAVSRLLTDTRTILSGIASMIVVAVFAGATGGTPISKPIFNLLYGTTADPNMVMVVGDSVPLRLMPTLTVEAQKQGLSVVSAARGSCSPMGIDLVYHPDKPTHSECPSVKEIQDKTISTYNPGYVLWWSRYEILDRYYGGQIISPDTELFWQAQKKDFVATVDRMTKNGSKVVVILTERPGLKTRERSKAELEAPILVNMVYHDEYRRHFNSIVKEVASTRDDVLTIDGDSLFCSKKQLHRSDSLCDDSIDGKFIRFDGSHVEMKQFGSIISRRVIHEFDKVKSQ